MRGVPMIPGGQPKRPDRVSPAAWHKRGVGEGRHHGSKVPQEAAVTRRRAANRRARASRRANR